MTNVLNIHSSLFAEGGVSHQLSAHLQQALASQAENIQFTNRDVVADEIPHFSSQTIADVGEGNAKLADTLIQEVQNADVVAIDAPMYNFSIPSQLKSWLDHLARAGTTFKYTENGPVGLLTNKTAIVITTRGGLHKDKPTDTQTSYLTTMLGFVGITDVHFVYAEGLNMGDELRSKAIEEAKNELLNIAQQLTNEDELQSVTA